MAEDIRIVEKPESLSWDAIRDCIWQAHESNRKRNIVMKTTTLTSEELEERLRHEALEWTTFLAYDSDRLVGCSSVNIKNKKSWFVNGRIGYYLLTAVIPEYQGRHLNTRFCEARDNWLKDRGVDSVFYDTAENNIEKIQMDMRHGFHKVDFFVPKGGDHYSVVLCKWFGRCPFSEREMNVRYLWRRFKIKFRFKEGAVKRFGI